MTPRTEVIVVGGGYAGVIAANRLTTRPDLTVTLINPRSSFVERIRLHQRIGGSHPAVVDYARVLAPAVALTADTVTRIHAEQRTLELASGSVRRYDYLVYAVGSHSAALTVPGAAEHALPLSTLEQADVLHAALASVGPAAPVTVVGGGATGIEAAAELAESGHPVTLVAGAELNPYLHERARREATRQLERLGATVLAGPNARVTQVLPRAVRLADGRELPSAVTVWTAGFGVPELATRSGLATDEIGRLLTDETLTSIDDDRIVAAGDSAAPSGLPYRMCCASAQPLGAHAAATVLRRIDGRSPRPVSVALPAQCLSLGRSAGLLQLAGLDDTARRTFVGGRAGAVLKEAITAGSVTGLQTLSRHPRMIPALTWMRNGKRAQRLAAASEPAGASAGAPVGGREPVADWIARSGARR